jgi:hypothetical protein
LLLSIQEGSIDIDEHLSEIAEPTYKQLDSWLAPIMQTWRFTP